jgi:outer membrane protein insertion porin family
MIFPRIVSNRLQVVFLPLLLCLLGVVLIPDSAKTAEHGTSKTGFLPLSVTGAGDLQSLRAEIDTQLSEALAATDVQFIPREEAASLADYQKAWPPPTEILRSIAEEKGFENIVTGTLTAVGSQISIDVKLFDLLTPTKPTYYSQIAQSGTELHNALIKIAADIDNYVKRDFLIASISPEGNNRIDSGAILSQIETKPGDPYNQATLRNDLKKIFQMGYFNDARIDVRDTPQGKQVIFKVTEKQMIQDVKYEGIDELKEDDVKAAANIKPNVILNPVKLSAAEEAITQLYKSKGFYNSKVAAKITYPDNNGAIVTFKIDEGKKIYIKKISVEGNVTFKESEIGRAHV